MGLFLVGPRFHATKATVIPSDFVLIPNRLIDLPRTGTLNLGGTGRCQSDPVAVSGFGKVPGSNYESHLKLPEFAPVVENASLPSWPNVEAGWGHGMANSRILRGR